MTNAQRENGNTIQTVSDFPCAPNTEIVPLQFQCPIIQKQKDQEAAHTLHQSIPNLYRQLCPNQTGTLIHQIHIRRNIKKQNQSVKKDFKKCSIDRTIKALQPVSSIQCFNWTGSHSTSETPARFF